jgi:hypothetical protein
LIGLPGLEMILLYFKESRPVNNPEGRNVNMYRPENITHSLIFRIFYALFLFYCLNLSPSVFFSCPVVAEGVLLYTELYYVGP